MRYVLWTDVFKDKENVDTFNVVRVGHDKVHNVLYIQYEGNKLYAYRGASVVMYENLLKAHSFKEYIEEQLNKTFHGVEVDL